MTWLCTAITAILSLATASSAPAQASPKDSVVAVVQEFFRAMKSNDATAAARTMHPDGRTFVMTTTGDSAVLTRSTTANFLAALSGNRRTFVERMWDATTMVHGSIAMLWTPYDFHIDGTFSHCGVDAFSLVRDTEGWRIVSIAYTVERTGCKPSPLGPLKKPGV
ncbi:MAG: nuclear transport factor 2 family protein [Gemmatimonas sp.]